VSFDGIVYGLHLVQNEMLLFYSMLLFKSSQVKGIIVYILRTYLVVRVSMCVGRAPSWKIKVFVVFVETMYFSRKDILKSRLVRL